MNVTETVSDSMWNLDKAQMANHSSEESMRKQSIDFESLKEVIESQRQKIIDVEQNNVLIADCKNELHELLKMVTKLVKKETLMDKECRQKELEQMKVLNSKMSRDVECIEKENEMITKKLEESKAQNDILQKKFTQENGVIMKELEESKSQNDMQKKKFTDEIRKVENEQLNAKVIQLKKNLEIVQKLESENEQLKEKLDVMKHMEDEFLNMVSALHMNVMEKEQSLTESEDFNQSLIIKERESNNELQKARKKLIEVIADTASLHGNIGVKQMGQIDTEPFLKALTVFRSLAYLVATGGHPRD
ncbi:hypothetical protein VNO78_02814 [Psophocarpus tetragonolobus]|uniref:Uncharacterized protein n=1 Tax=Psophocarpus tetragonolobus TaxID=3891 RepID=A0AAN9SZH9_PSOTE